MSVPLTNRDSDGSSSLWHETLQFQMAFRWRPSSKDITGSWCCKYYFPNLVSVMNPLLFSNCFCNWSDHTGNCSVLKFRSSDALLLQYVTTFYWLWQHTLFEFDFNNSNNIRAFFSNPFLVVPTIICSPAWVQWIHLYGTNVMLVQLVFKVLFQ